MLLITVLFHSDYRTPINMDKELYSSYAEIGKLMKCVYCKKGKLTFCDNATERVNIGHSYESGLCIEWQRKSVAWYNITIQYSYNLKFRSVHWFIYGFSIVISRSTWLHNSIILYVFYRKPAMHTSEFLSHPNLFL